MAWEYLLFAALGGLAGFIRLVLTNKGMIPLPKIVEQKGSRYVNLGFITPIVIGLVAGGLAPHALGANSFIAFVSGYFGSDVIENLVERAKGLPKSVD